MERFNSISTLSTVKLLGCATCKPSYSVSQVVGTLYTHHQKITIVDTQGPVNKRQLISFIGGLDLCEGRWDTPAHSLFNTMPTVHKNDYHNPTFSVSLHQKFFITNAISLLFFNSCLLKKKHERIK